MNFAPKKGLSPAQKGTEAYDFLMEAIKEGKLDKVENMDDVMDAYFGLLQHAEYLEGILKSYNIPF
jgi:hypothetical protein